MKFSVIIPVYNCERYLDRSVQSVLEQSFADWELILIDDGSTDSSGKICDDYQQRIPEKIQVIHQENLGVLYARRAGMQQSHGEYICFLDSDDSWHINTLEILNQYQQEYNPDIIFFGYRKVIDLKKIEGPIVLSTEVTSIEKDAMSVVHKKVIEGAISCLWAETFRRSLIDWSRDYSPYRKVFKGEDLLQNLALIDNANSVLFIPDVLYSYFQYESGLTQRKIDQAYLDSHLIVQNVLMEYVESWGIPQKAGIQLFANVYRNVLKSLITNSLFQPRYSRQECIWLIKYLTTGEMGRYLDDVKIVWDKKAVAIATWLLKMRLYWALCIFVYICRILYAIRKSMTNILVNSKKEV
ncbi:glycosyltransferase family A protein [uncultured Sphaerochaeta sp.]|uniref:glycosyltransferase family 2 protein n=1 Tax=uncultured Sphaerochaeta sp. TaxID=886478 RepID=UPI002A0A2F8B|nr:glycosyltransferase family A protein [uncultured Sphaerochaeta sp.]